MAPQASHRHEPPTGPPRRSHNGAVTAEDDAGASGTKARDLAASVTGWALRRMTGRVDEAPASHAAVPQPAEPAGPPSDVDKLSSVLLELEALRLNFARLADQLTELVKSGHEHEAKWVDELRRLWSELEQVQKRQLQFELSMLSTGVGALRGNLDRVRHLRHRHRSPRKRPARTASTPKHRRRLARRATRV